MLGLDSDLGDREVKYRKIMCCGDVVKETAGIPPSRVPLRKSTGEHPTHLGGQSRHRHASASEEHLRLITLCELCDPSTPNQRVYNQVNKQSNGSP